jgi:hypothetical protein
LWIALDAAGAGGSAGYLLPSPPGTSERRKVRGVGQTASKWVKALDTALWNHATTNERQRAAAPQRAARNGLRRREGFGRAEC